MSWEPFGEPGMGGYVWGQKPDGSWGMVPGGITFDEQPLIATDVGGVEHIDQAAARSLLHLIREHREHCPGEDCTVSLMTLLPVYRQLAGGSADAEILKEFL